MTSVTYTAKKGLKLFGNEVGSFLNNSKTSDISVTENNLTEFGTVLESAVDQGSAVFGYSGFSSVNYLSQGIESAFDFGSGDFSICCWVKFGSSTTGTIFDRSNGADDANRINFYIQGTTQILHLIINGTDVSNVGFIPLNEWTFICVKRESSIISAYINSNIVNTVASASSVSGSFSSRIGLNLLGLSEFNGSLSNIEILPTTLSDSQIKEKYDSEREMFKKNSVFTISGDEYSLDIGIDKDERTELVKSKAPVSIGGSQETVLQRVDVFHEININNVPKNSLPIYRNWLQSVNSGEVFTIDMDGTIALPEDPVSVISDGGHSENRVGTLDLYNIPVKLREI